MGTFHLLYLLLAVLLFSGITSTFGKRSSSSQNRCKSALSKCLGSGRVACQGGESNVRCLNRNIRCNGVVECPGGDDEIGCGGNRIRPTTTIFRASTRTLTRTSTVTSTSTSLSSTSTTTTTTSLMSSSFTTTVSLTAKVIYDTSISSTVTATTSTFGFVTTSAAAGNIIAISSGLCLIGTIGSNGALASASQIAFVPYTLSVLLTETASVSCSPKSTLYE